MGNEDLHNADQIPRVRRPVVPAAQAQPLIVDATIELLRELPFDQVTAKIISEKVQLSMPTIWRNFVSMEGLLTYACSVLMTGAVERWRANGSLPTITIFYDPDIILRTRLVAWLIGEGANPEHFRSPLLGSLIEEFRNVMPGVNRRTATSWVYTTTTLLQGNVLFGDVNGISEEIVADNYALMTYFRELLPQAAEALGWNN